VSRFCDAIHVRGCLQYVWDVVSIPDTWIWFITDRSLSKVIDIFETGEFWGCGDRQRHAYRYTHRNSERNLVNTSFPFSCSRRWGSLGYGSFFSVSPPPLLSPHSHSLSPPPPCCSLLNPAGSYVTTGSFRNAPHLFSVTAYLAPSLHVKKISSPANTSSLFYSICKNKSMNLLSGNIVKC